MRRGGEKRGCAESSKYFLTHFGGGRDKIKAIPSGVFLKLSVARQLPSFRFTNSRHKIQGNRFCFALEKKEIKCVPFFSPFGGKTGGGRLGSPLLTLGGFLFPMHEAEEAEDQKKKNNGGKMGEGKRKNKGAF